LINKFVEKGLGTFSVFEQLIMNGIKDLGFLGLKKRDDTPVDDLYHFGRIFALNGLGVGSRFLEIENHFLGEFSDVAVIFPGQFFEFLMTPFIDDNALFPHTNCFVQMSFIKDFKPVH